MVFAQIIKDDDYTQYPVYTAAEWESSKVDYAPRYNGAINFRPIFAYFRLFCFSIKML